MYTQSSNELFDLLKVCECTKSLKYIEFHEYDTENTNSHVINGNSFILYIFFYFVYEIFSFCEQFEKGIIHSE